MKTGKFLASVLVIVMAFSTAAYAEKGEGKGHKGERMMKHMFEKSDLDGDGVVTKEEFMKGAEERFTKMDGDADGKITKDEMKVHHEEMKEKWKTMKEMKSNAEGEAKPAE